MHLVAFSFALAGVLWIVVAVVSVANRLHVAPRSTGRQAA
jgi:hypothetical protein